MSKARAVSGKKAAVNVVTAADVGAQTAAVQSPAQLGEKPVADVVK